jgi:hypothetical protein
VGKNIIKILRANTIEVLKCSLCEDAYCIFLLQFLSKRKSIYSANCFFLFLILLTLILDFWQTWRTTFRITHICSIQNNTEPVAFLFRHQNCLSFSN